MKIKTLIYILQYRIGKRLTLPATYINSKPIHDNGSAVINIVDNPKFSMDELAIERGGLWVRTEMKQRLSIVADKLPDGLKLHFYVGWRHIAYQKNSWHRQFNKFREQYPEKSDTEIERMTKAFVANPYGDGVAPHQTGGAVDLTLVDANGYLLDMGTKYSEFNKKTPTKSKLITKQQSRNRLILLNAMRAAGIQNYPGEWWHFSYGDRMWAAYKCKRNAIYGKTYTNEFILNESEKQYT
jgi:D-alanyl-D-alanine dipeptidase